MTKKKSSPKPVRIALPEPSDILKRPIVPLVYEQRIRLQEIFNDPVFVQAWANTNLCKPSAIPAGLEGPLGVQIGNNRLHQIQGWELFRAALMRQAEEVIPTKPKPVDNFPDAGTIEADMQQRMKK